MPKTTKTKEARAGLIPASDDQEVHLRLSRGAWVTLEDTLRIDAESSAFDKSLREEIRDALGKVEELDLDDAIAEAKAALVGDSNDDEHDALVSLVRAMGLEIPECVAHCEDKFFENDGKHAKDCPAAAWQKEGK